MMDYNTLPKEAKLFALLKALDIPLKQIANERGLSHTYLSIICGGRKTTQHILSDILADLERRYEQCQE